MATSSDFPRLTEAAARYVEQHGKSLEDSYRAMTEGIATGDDVTMAKMSRLLVNIAVADRTIGLKSIEVLQGFADGLHAHEIARERHIEENTVRSHMKRVRTLLGQHTIAGCVAEGYRRGWLV